MACELYCGVPDRICYSVFMMCRHPIMKSFIPGYNIFISVGDGERAQEEREARGHSLLSSSLTDV